jgi:hypothetical protein
MAETFAPQRGRSRKRGTSAKQSRPAAKMGWKASRRAQVVFDRMALFHDESDSLQFADIGEGVAGHGDKVCEPSRLYRADAILPSPAPATRRSTFLPSSTLPNLSLEWTARQCLIDVGGSPARRKKSSLPALRYWEVRNPIVGVTLKPSSR